MARMGAILILSLLVLPSVAAGATAQQPILAVFDIQDTRPARSRLSKQERADLTALLVASLTEGGLFKVVPTAQIRAILNNKKSESFKACYDERCQVAIGRELAAQKTLSTRIIKMGKRCAVIGTMFDLRQAASERAAVVKCACAKEQFLDALEALAKKLQSRAGDKASIKPVPPAAPPPKDPVPKQTEAERLYKLGVKAYDQRLTEKAIQHFAAAEKAGFDDWRKANDLYHHWGEAYRIYKNDKVAATRMLTRCVEISQDKKDWPAPWCEYLLGIVHYNQSRPDPALVHFQRAVGLLTKDQWVYANDMYHMMGEAYRVHKKDFVKAREFHQKAIDVSQDRKDWPAYWSAYIMGLMANEEGAWDLVIKRCQQALAMHPKMPWEHQNDIFHVLGEVYRNQKKDRTRATRFHQQAVDVSLNKSDWPAFWSEYILGYMAFEDQNSDLAIKKFHSALAMNPQMDSIFKNDIFHMLGEVYRQHKKDRAQASRFHQQAIDVSQNKTDWPAAWSKYILGLMAYEQGNTERAIALCQDALAMDPKMNPIHQNDIYHVLGEIYRNQKMDLKQAAIYHQKSWAVAEDKSDWPSAWSMYLAGYIANDLGHGKEAVACFDKTKPYLDKMSWILQNDIHYAYGESYRRHLNSPRKALKHYKKCLRVSSDLSDWPAYWCLMRQAEILRSGKRAREAQAMFSRAREAGKADQGFLVELDRVQNKR